MSVGRGALLTKLNVRNAFRLIPISPDDWRLLSIHWQYQYYFQKMLPFGLRSSPFIFNQVAEAIEWILRHQFAIPIIMHYLDDYLSVVTGLRTVNELPPRSSPRHTTKDQYKLLEIFFFYFISVGDWGTHKEEPTLTTND